MDGFTYEYHEEGVAPQEQIFAGLTSQVGIGAVTGGVTSEIVNGQFLHGFGQGAWTAAYGFIFNETLDAFGEGMATPNPGQDPDTWRSWDTAQAGVEAINSGNDPTNLQSNLAIIAALPLAPLTIAAGPELYSLTLLYPEAVLIGAGFAEGITPPLSGVSVNAYGYAAGVAASNFLPQGMVGP